MTQHAAYILLLGIVHHFDAYDILADNGADPHEDEPATFITLEWLFLAILKFYAPHEDAAA